MSDLSVSDSGDKWSVKSEGDTLVWKFEEGMELSKFKQEAYPLYKELVSEHTEEINGMVTVIELDDAFNEEAFKVWENAGQKAQDEGIERWALVADGLTKISLKGKLDYDDLEVKAFEDSSEAIDWSRK